jgi:hypothetical protein
MRFLPTVDMWNAATQDAVRSGQLRLLPGQWCQCGPGPKSRFVRVTEHGSIWLVHAEGPHGKLGIKRARFSEYCRAWKGV